MSEIFGDLEAVNDEKSFLEFVRTLLADRRGNAAAWENDSIEQFLEAALSWAEDSDFGTRQGLSSANPWRRAAAFLYCGKIYE